MSASRRKAIRDQVKELLLGKTDVGERVFSNPSNPTWAEELPVILIRSLSESTEKYAEAPREFKRDLQILVEIIVQGQEDGTCPEDCAMYVEDKLDQIAFQVDCFLLADDRLGCDVSTEKAIADNFEPTSAEFDFVSEGEKPIGLARLIYTATYYEQLPANLDKAAGLADFKTVAADWHVGHHDDEPDLTETERSDLIDIPQT